MCVLANSEVGCSRQGKSSEPCLALITEASYCHRWEQMQGATVRYYAEMQRLRNFGPLNHSGMSPSKLSPQRSKKPIDVEAGRVEKLEGVKDKRKQGLQIDMMESHMKAEAETECLGALFV